MKIYLLPATGNDYKANLHCHSTFSDGRMTPEELKQAYMAKGYAIIAYTDHNRLVDHQDLTDENFLALNGYEIDISDIESGLSNQHYRTCHICLVAKDPTIPEMPVTRLYAPENINAIMRAAHDAGYYVTYNHPTWSNERYPDYSGYEGMDAMEIWNTGCVVEGWDDYNCHAYDDLLHQNKRIGCIAADDNHNHRPLSHPTNDSFGGWICLRAPRLDYPTIVRALENGDYYASCGPEIKELYIEDGFVHIKTSPAHRISYITYGRHHGVAAANYGESVTEAVFSINPNDIYFRIDVIDDYGRHANTNAVFLDTLEL